MKKSVAFLVSAVVAATCAAPSAFARHRIHKAAAVVAATPRIDQYGQFYATPVQADAPADLGLVPGLGLANGVIAGASQPLLAPAGPNALPILGPIPGLDAAGDVVNGLTLPLLAPVS